MTLNRNKLYSIIFIACLAGYIWLYFNITKNLTKEKQFEVCFVKHLTNIPCPSCGATRSVLSLTNGNFIEAFNLNPIGYVIAIIMFIAPLWIITDVVMKSKTLFYFYEKIEMYLKKPKFAIPLIFLVLINWIWNIIKGI
jgi:hypothetical protein